MKNDEKIDLRSSYRKKVDQRHQAVFDDYDKLIQVPNAVKTEIYRVLAQRHGYENGDSVRILIGKRLKS